MQIAEEFLKVYSLTPTNKTKLSTTQKQSNKKEFKVGRLQQFGVCKSLESTKELKHSCNNLNIKNNYPELAGFLIRK